MQVVEARELTAQAAKQRLRDLTLSPHRGSIYDREGEKLAVTAPARTIYAVPSQVKDATGTAQALARALGGDAKDYLRRLHRTGSFVYIARKVDLARASAVATLGIDGIGQVEDSRRSYPSGDLACQILGFVGVDDEGLAGIEKQYDSTLAGKAGRVLAERDPRGNIIPGGVVRSEEPIDGQDIYLTIDKDIQYQAHLELAAAVKQFGAKGGSVVVMDPRTGEILRDGVHSLLQPQRLRRGQGRRRAQQGHHRRLRAGFHDQDLHGRGRNRPASLRAGHHVPPAFHSQGRRPHHPRVARSRDGGLVAGADRHQVEQHRRGQDRHGAGQEAPGRVLRPFRPLAANGRRLPRRGEGLDAAAQRTGRSRRWATCRSGRACR